MVTLGRHALASTFPAGAIRGLYPLVQGRRGARGELTASMTRGGGDFVFAQIGAARPARAADFPIQQIPLRAASMALGRSSCLQLPVRRTSAPAASAQGRGVAYPRAREARRDRGRRRILFVNIRWCCSATRSGRYASGIVEKCGAQATTFAVGEEFFGMVGIGGGGYAEKAVVDQGDRTEAAGLESHPCGGHFPGGSDGMAGPVPARPVKGRSVRP